MKNLKSLSGIFVIALAFLLGGCYTQVALDNNNSQDRNYTYNDQNYESQNDSTEYYNDSTNYNYYDDQYNDQAYYNIHLGYWGNYRGWYNPTLDFGFPYRSYYNPFYYYNNYWTDPFWYSTWCGYLYYSYYRPYYYSYWPYGPDYNNYPYYFYNDQGTRRFRSSGGYLTRNNNGGRGSVGTRLGTGSSGRFYKPSGTTNTRVTRSTTSTRSRTYTNSRTRSGSRNTVRQNTRENNGSRSVQRGTRSRGQQHSYTPPPRKTYSPPARTYSPPSRTYSPPSRSGSSSRGTTSRGSSSRGRGR